MGQGGSLQQSNIRVSSAPSHRTETTELEITTEDEKELFSRDTLVHIEEEIPLIQKAESWDGNSLGSEGNFPVKEVDEQNRRQATEALVASRTQQSFRRKATRRSSFSGFIGGTYELEPINALVPLINGTPPNGTVVHQRPAPTVKSIPPFAPYRRLARHRSFYLYWLNEFRHWWKSSRLLVRLGGLLVFALDPLIWEQLTTANFLKRKGRKQSAKLGKHLGQGGPMHGFLQMCRPFTRTLRIIVGAWRWIEAAKPRRGEVGLEEGMVSKPIQIHLELHVWMLAKYVLIGLCRLSLEIGVREYWQNGLWTTSHVG